MHPWVILFDIDGTLLTVNRDFNRPLLRRIVNNLNINYPELETDSFSGRTDYDILYSFLKNHRYDAELYNKLKADYIAATVQQISSNHIYRQPFIDEALAYFESIGSYIGLLTGNYPETAQAKLNAAGIRFPFKFGVFGEFDRNRNNLPRLAIETVQAKLQVQPMPERFVVIGDTLRDIECAKSARMKSVAVATGRFSAAELAAGKPDILLPDLSEPEHWFKELTGDTLPHKKQ